ncbi:MAG: S8 family serine peptidase, partial [Thermoplasmatales archaeon]
DIGAPEAWSIETGDPDVVIAIADSGINYSHPDLADKIWINEDEIPSNGIDDDDNGYTDDVRGWDFAYNDSDPMDGNGHGTVCAGVPGMVTNNSIGGAGVIWDCQIIPVQIANETWFGWWDDIANGIKYAADNAADIISMSFGGYVCPDIVEDAVDYAYGKGVFLCAAAHNHNTSNECYPAAFKNVTAVAATNQHDERCDEDDWGPGSGSNYGDWVDVAAPGNLIGTTSLDPEFYYYTAASGTSLSTPMVAGLAALILSKNPVLSPDDIKSVICKNVDPYNSSEYIGTGRINAYKALANVSSSRKAFLLGLIANLTSDEDIISSNAKIVLSIGFGPFGIDIYRSNEKIIVTQDKLGYVGPRFIIGFFSATVI